MIERIGPTEKLGFERSVAKHRLIKDALGQVIPGLWILRSRRRFRGEISHGLIVFEVVEVVEAGRQNRIRSAK